MVHILSVFDFKKSTFKFLHIYLGALFNIWMLDQPFVLPSLPYLMRAFYMTDIPLDYMGITWAGNSPIKINQVETNDMIVKLW